MITPTKKRLVCQELAMLFAEHGHKNIPDIKTLLTYNPAYMGNLREFNRIFKGNWGAMMTSLEASHPDLMDLAKDNVVKVKVKPAAKPKAVAKPAAKSAVKKEK